MPPKAKHTHNSSSNSIVFTFTILVCKTDKVELPFFFLSLSKLSGVVNNFWPVLCCQMINDLPHPYYLSTSLSRLVQMERTNFVYKTKNIHLLFYPATLNQKEEIKKMKSTLVYLGAGGTHTHTGCNWTNEILSQPK